MSNMNKLEDKGALLQKTQAWTDCIFYFDGQKVAAHKLILTCYSPVFESMFYGGLASAEIQISDIDVEDFKQMLEFLYTKKIVITSVMNAWSLFYIGHKYFLNELKNICIDYISFNLTLSSLLLSYEYAELYNLRQLSEKCWRDILLSTTEILQLDYHMQPSTFCLLVEENEINAKEEDLIAAALKWAEEECSIRNLQDTKDNKFKILIEAGIFQHLRFTSLKKNSFFYQLMADNSKPLSEYLNFISIKIEQRTRVPYYIKYKFRETYKIEQNITLGDNYEFQCKITSLKKIAVYGIAITPPHQGGFSVAHSTVIVTICDKLGNSILQTKDVVEVLSNYEYPHLINFNRGIIMESKTPYLVSLRYNSASGNKPNELLCFYIGSEIKTHANSLSISFNDEKCSGVVRGLSYYVV